MTAGTSENTLTAIMIVKDNGASLPRCLANLETFCDHIVAYDDGSKDKSVDILRSHPLVRHVVSFNKGYHSEAIDRSVALALADLTKPSWILTVSADEFLDEFSANNIRPLMDLSGFKAWSFNRFITIDDENLGDLQEDHWCLFRYESGKVFHFDHRINNDPCMDQLDGAWGQCNLRIINQNQADNRTFQYCKPIFEWEKTPDMPLLYRPTSRPFYFFSSQEHVDKSQADHRAWRRPKIQDYPSPDFWMTRAWNYLHNLAPIEAEQALQKLRKSFNPGRNFFLDSHSLLREGILHYLLGRWDQSEVTFHEVASTCREYWPYMAFYAERYLERIPTKRLCNLLEPRDPELVDEQWFKQRYIPWFIDELKDRKAVNIHLYGAGQHTHKLQAAGFFKQIEVTGIIDDAQADNTLFDIPVISLSDAIKVESALVVISTDCYERELIKRLHPSEIGSALLQPMYETLWPTPFWFNERR